jgi:thiol peroxidase
MYLPFAATPVHWKGAIAIHSLHKEGIMTEERTGIITFKGNPMTLLGPELKAGDPAPGFTVVDTALNPVNLDSYAGKIKVLSAVPSLDTPTCDTETRRFNVEAGKLPGGVEVWTISMDLPFAQKRWCGEAGVSHRVLSSYNDEKFGEDWGVLIKAMPLRRVLQRAIFVLDKDNTLRYVDYCPEIAEQPNFDAALAAAGNLA